MTQKATIYDISKLANVSIATVSRVVNNDSSVKDKTREKVIEVMNKLRYRPSQSARLMGEKRDTVSVGVLYRYASSGFFTELLKGIDQALSQKNCLMMASRLKEEPSTIDEVQEYIKRSGAQALIMLYPEWSKAFIDYLKSSSVPIVVIGEPHEEDIGYQVNSDSKKSLETLVKKLVKKSRRDTVIVHGPNTNREAQERLETTLKVLNALEISSEEISLINGEFQPEVSKEKLGLWLESHTKNKPFNLICHNDSMALASMALLMEKGYSIPRDVAVMGHDDIEFAETFNLSTIRVNFEKLGEIAAGKALRLLKYEEVERRTIVQSEAILRSSI